MNSIYKVKEKWAECFMKNAFTLGMRSTQLSESLNNDLKHHLKSDLDIIRFFHHLEYDSRKYLPTSEEELHGYDHITNFTELLNMPSSEPYIGEDIF
jgi:hypothetical protein